MRWAKCCWVVAWAWPRPVDWRTGVRAWVQPREGGCAWEWEGLGD